MIRHTITFCKCIKQDIEESVFKLNASVTLPEDKELLKKVNKFCQSYTKTVFCKVNGSTLNIYITTKAKCSPYDVPDLVKGKRIAESKAKTNLYNVLKSLASLISLHYNNLFDRYASDFSKYLSLRDKEFKHISDLDNTK